jgi:hypothetical protein
MADLALHPLSSPRFPGLAEAALPWGNTCLVGQVKATQPGRHFKAAVVSLTVCWHWQGSDPVASFRLQRCNGEFPPLQAKGRPMGRRGVRQSLVAPIRASIPGSGAQMRLSQRPNQNLDFEIANNRAVLQLLRHTSFSARPGSCQTLAPFSRFANILAFYLY